MEYLLDTNICIHFLKGDKKVSEKIIEVGLEKCSISEITYAELIFGAENSVQRDNNINSVEQLASLLTILPVFEAIHIYGKEKARLRKKGRMISDLDLFIGSTAIAFELIMVTRNVSEFNRINKLKIENWVD
jgi:tRNA(fMet)-specific endonuclease VapC